jgi:hypothetical protein
LTFDLTVHFQAELVQRRNPTGRSAPARRLVPPPCACVAPSMWRKITAAAAPFSGTASALPVRSGRRVECVLCRPQTRSGQSRHVVAAPTRRGLKQDSPVTGVDGARSCA